MKYYSKIKAVNYLSLFVLLAAIMYIVLISALNAIEDKDAYLYESNCGTENLDAEIKHVLNQYDYFIATVGDGSLDETLVSNRPYSTQSAQGYDLYQGIKYAYDTFKFENTKGKIGLLSIDDGGNPECAKKISEILSKQPKLLGVIGHSTTECTKVALPNYQISNIPFLIPAATNPQLESYSSKYNYFRLPSNDNIQALIIADLIINKFKSKRVYIIWDNTEEARTYSEYLKGAVNNIFEEYEFKGEREVVVMHTASITLNPLNYSYVFKSIVSKPIDAVIYIGYGSLAREFLLGLSYEYSISLGVKKPIILLSDGCKVAGLENFGFEIYITFPSNSIKNFNQFKNFNPGKKITRHKFMYLEESFEVFGYDAATLLLSAIDTVFGSNIARSEIIKNIPTVEGNTCNTYEFHNGENTIDRYYTYSVASDSFFYSYDDTEIENLKKSLLK